MVIFLKKQQKLSPGQIHSSELLTEQAFVTSPCVKSTDDIVISRLRKESQDTQRTVRVSKNFWTAISFV